MVFGGRSPTNMFSVAADGATSRASITFVSPCAVRISMKPPPPTPLAMGLSTPWHRAVATAASTAFPPSTNTLFPAHHDSGYEDGFSLASRFLKDNVDFHIIVRFSFEDLQEVQ